MGQASIPVGSEEVPLSLYFQVVDLWSTGYSITNIINTLINRNTSTQSLIFADTIANIIYNQEVMQQAAVSATSTLHVMPQNSRRLSRIASVNELDDLSVAQMVAEKKEKEKLGLRQMLAKLTT